MLRKQIVMFFGIVMALATFQGCGQIPNAIDDRLVGIWYTESHQTRSGATLKIRGTSEYVEDGTSNYVGEITVQSSARNQTAKMIFHIQMAGEWGVQNDTLVERVVEIKSLLPVEIEYGRKRVKFSQMDLGVREKFRGFKDSLASSLQGVTEESQILATSPRRIKLKMLDSNGDYMEITGYRRTKHFQLS